MEMKIRLPKHLRDAHVISIKKQKVATQVADELALNSGTSYRLHVYYVYHDPEFKAAVRKLIKYLDAKYYKDISLNADFGHVVDMDRQLIIDVADKFCITPEDIRLYADGWYAVGAPYGISTRESGVVQNNRGIYYKIGPKTTQQDIINEWDYIETLREEYFGQKHGKSR